MPRRFGEKDRGNPYARRMALLELIYTSKGKVRINDIANQFKIQHNLLAYDLQQLEQLGLVERGYGWVKRRTVGIENLFDGSEFIARMSIAREAKEKIAWYIAEKLIEPGDQVVFDAGTTAFLVLHHLVNMEKAVTIWTNNIPLFLYAMANSNMVCRLLGGELSRTHAALVGEEPARQIAEQKFKLAIVTPKGVLLQDIKALRRAISEAQQRQEGEGKEEKRDEETFFGQVEKFLRERQQLEGVAVTLFNEDQAQHLYKRTMVLSATKVLIAVDKHKWSSVGRPFLGLMSPVQLRKPMGAVRTRGAALPLREEEKGQERKELVTEWPGREMAVVTDATLEEVAEACPDVDVESPVFQKWAALEEGDRGLICLAD